jgi:hypothetical protein
LFEAWLANRRYLDEFAIVPVIKSAERDAASLDRMDPNSIYPTSTEAAWA